MSREGQITDRYTAAVNNLGDDKADVRLGGVYALQRLMQDSPRDQPTVAGGLNTYVRTHATKTQSNGTTPSEVQAAVTVLADRDASQDDTFLLNLKDAWLPGAFFLPPDRTAAHLEKANLINARLMDAKLTKARLTQAQLTDATLTDAHLEKTTLTNADLGDAELTGALLLGADLTRANLSGADLTDADIAWAHGTDGTNLYDADLVRADLTEASLRDADLGKADLTDADLTDADLHRTSLRGAELSLEQARSAFITSATKLPSALAKDPELQKQISKNDKNVEKKQKELKEQQERMT